MLFLIYAEDIDPGNDTEQYLHPEKQEDPKKKKSIIKTRKRFEKGNVEIALGGAIHPEMGLVGQDYKGENGERDGKKPHFNVADANIYFQGTYLDDSGWKAGYTIRFDPLPGALAVDRSYVEFEHPKLGILQFGNQKSVHDLFGKLAQNNMPTFWIDGWMDNYIYAPGKCIFEGNELIGDTGNATKFNWISPSISGFKLAFSYTPSTKSRGKNDRNDIDYKNGDKATGNSGIWKDDKNQPFGNHHLTFMAVFDKACQDWKFTAAGVFMMDKSYYKGEKDKVNDVRAGMVSALIGYKKVSLACEFLCSGKSRLPIDGNITPGADVDSMFAKGNAGKAINTTLAWEITNKHKVGLGYQHTWKNFGDDGKGKKDLVSLGYSFKFLECASWNTEISYFRYKCEGADASRIEPDGDQRDNKGFLLLSGIRIEI